MVGSRPVGSGLGSTRLNTPQGLQQEIILPIPRIDEGLQPDSRDSKKSVSNNTGPIRSKNLSAGPIRRNPGSRDSNNTGPDEESNL